MSFSPSGRSRPSSVRRALRHPVVAGSALAFLLVLVGLAAVLLRLDRELAERWTGRWDVPSRVYSAPLDLYPGLQARPADLLQALAARAYREAAPGSGPPPPGTFRREGERLTVGLHDFPYPDGTARGFPLELRLRGGRIAGMRDAATGRELFTARLEPVEVAALFDARMESRSPVRLAEVSPILVEAVLAIEDRRFRRHAGLDPWRTVAAAVRNIRSGAFEQGGSTITQQVIKNYFLTREKTLRRKLKEALMAVVFELRHSKDEILEAYLNEVYLGQRGPVSVVGVGEAARHYFSREPGQLDLAEAALLAGLIRSPATYDPFRNPERARTRRATVLQAMHEQGRIDREARERAAAAPLPSPAGRRPLDGAPYFTDFVVRELRDRFSADALRREGYRIYTTLDPRAQAAADRAVREGLEALERAHPRLTRDGAGPQAALVALDPQTGELLALVGGRDFGTSQFNRAVQARRQPGSAFKPFVYLAALDGAEGGHTLATLVSDSALSLVVNGRAWTPENYDGLYRGAVSVREALEQSYNIATVRLALSTGLERVVETARRVGISSPLRPVPSVALGAFEVTPLEMAVAYSVLAAGGTGAQPLSVVDVLDASGERLVGHELAVRRAAEAGPAYLVNRALQGALRRGTGAAAAALGYAGRAAGKTGTSSGYRDAWFVGYTPRLVALVWVGTDDNRSLGLPGARAALPIWVRFMRLYGPAGREADFPPPEGIVQVAIDPSTGRLAHGRCGPARVEVFLEGTEPLESCRDGPAPVVGRVAGDGR